MNEDWSLDSNGRDALVAALRSASSIVPVIGGPLVEIFTRVIPDQRLDRVCLFLENLSQRVGEIENRIKGNEYFSDLFQDAVQQAARALSEERNSAIAIFLSRCTEVDLKSYEMKKKLLQVLQELTDMDLEVLRSYASYEYMRLHSKFPREFASKSEYDHMSDEEKFEYESSLEQLDSHLQILVRFRLLDEEFETRAVDSMYLVPEIDRDGRLKPKGHKITAFGRLLLSSISDGYVGRP